MSRPGSSSGHKAGLHEHAVQVGPGTTGLQGHAAKVPRRVRKRESGEFFFVCLFVFYSSTAVILQYCCNTALCPVLVNLCSSSCSNDKNFNRSPLNRTHSIERPGENRADECHMVFCARSLLVDFTKGVVVMVAPSLVHCPCFLTSVDV